MNKSKQTLWPTSSIVCLIQDQTRCSTSDLVLEALMYRHDRTQTGHDGFGTHFFLLDACVRSCCYLGVLEGDKTLVPSHSVALAAGVVISLMENTSIIGSVSLLLESWLVERLGSTRQPGWGAQLLALLWRLVLAGEGFSLVDQGISQLFCQGIIYNFMGFFSSVALNMGLHSFILEWRYGVLCTFPVELVS